jgi:hypothetical protein
LGTPPARGCRDISGGGRLKSQNLFADLRVLTGEVERKAVMQNGTQKPYQGRVYCPICTHTVGGAVKMIDKKPQVIPGQKCARCHSALDAGIVLRVMEAA